MVQLTSHFIPCAGRVVVTYRGKVPVDYECHEKIGKVERRAASCGCLHVPIIMKPLLGLGFVVFPCFCIDGVHWCATLMC